MAPDTNSKSSTGVAAVDRALAIATAISLSGEPITLAELARQTGLYKSTLLRLIASLEKVSLVTRLTDGRYALGPYARELGQRYDASYRLTQVLRPMLDGLVAQGTESASFHVYHDDTHRMCVLRVNSHHSTLDHISEGDLLPLAHGAAGKLIRAFRGKNVVPSLDNVVSISLGERDPNCAAVACAVFTRGNEFCGAISLSGPKERFSTDAIHAMSDTIRKAAKEATEALGGLWPKV
jgi:DNA-binding IclR family transcriptional regulator